MRTHLSLCCTIVAAAACAARQQPPSSSASALPELTPPCLASETTPLDTYDSLLAQALAAMNSGHHQRAMPLLERAAQLAPLRPEAYVLWGRGLAALGRQRAALDKYEHARELGDRSELLFTELTSLYEMSQRYDEAILVYRDFLRDHPEHVEMRSQLALTLLLSQRAAQALPLLTQLTRELPDDLQLQQDLGLTYLTLHRFDAAIATLEAVLQREPQRWEAMRMLARAYGKNGDIDQALSWITRALAAHPDDAAALAMRARLQAAQASQKTPRAAAH